MNLKMLLCGETAEYVRSWCGVGAELVRSWTEDTPKTTAIILRVYSQQTALIQRGKWVENHH
jgi:hypothetical protein